LLKETSWIPVDGIPWRETTRFSQDKFVVKVWEIDLGHKEAKQNVDVNFRIFPFSPTWLWFAVSLDLEDIWWQESNSNYLALYLLHFEKRGMSVVPVINTIQNSFRNIWIDNNWKLYHVNEPLNEQERAKWITLLEESDWDLKVKKAKKQEILESIEKNILSWLHMDTEIIAIISDNLFHSWFSSVEGINWRDNLWLAKHSWRTPKGIENTVDWLYRKVFKTLWWKETECGNMEIDFLGVFKYLSRYPKGLDVLERISWLVGSLTWEVNKLLANPTSEKNMQNAENFNSKILENLGYLNTRWTKLENFVDLYASMTWKLVMDLLDTSDWRRKLIIWTEESRRHLRDKRVTEHENRVEIALSAQLNSLYSVSMRVEEIINSWWNVWYLPNIKDIIDNILSIKFY
jgi:hypothetical protein